MKGSMALVDFDGTIVFYQQYEGVTSRNRIIKTWRAKIGKKIERMYIQIAPDYYPRIKPRN